MNPALPTALKARISALLEGVSRKELAARAAAISAGYRSGANSATMITDEVAVLAYLLTRMPATYAVAAAVFAEVYAAIPEFTPKTFCDVGAGPGTASWAAVETWSDIAHVTVADSNSEFLQAARTLSAGSPNLERASYVAFSLGSSTPQSSDLVIASYVLAEIAEQSQEPVVHQLWFATNEILVLIEPGTPAGFARIRRARQLLIAHGAHVLAPCTHDNTCPISGTDWCHFSQRLPRSRDHLKMKDAKVPFEDERYSYVVMSRRPVERGNIARIIAPPEETKAGVSLQLCADRGLQRAFIAKRQRDVYALLRKAKWGDTIASDE